MKILLDKSSFDHNIDYTWEWSYRLKELSPNINIDWIIVGEKYLSLVHSEKYIRKIKRACEVKWNIAEIKLSPESYIAACNAVWLTILASQNNDFAVVRPPWHHAFHEISSWFCLFNNIAVASQKLVNEWNKVAIIDIDGHHWDWTQRIFFETDRVHFTSIHQIETFPWTWYTDEIWKWKWKWYTKNYTLNKWDWDKEFLKALDNVIDNVLEFNPDVVWISVGFDGYYKDSVLDLELTSWVYKICWRKLSENFKNIFAVLEWWYHSDIKECLDNFIDWINSK